MHASIRSAAVDGVDASLVIVELDSALGLPTWTIVGLPANAVKEGRERVNAALSNSGFVVPSRRITVNLAPADFRKKNGAALLHWGGWRGAGAKRGSAIVYVRVYVTPSKSAKCALKVRRPRPAI